MKSTLWILVILFAATCVAVAQQSPASQKPPQTVNAQSYPREQVLTGQTRFADECAFCHGRDAAGGETGPDLTRSVIVAEDLRGDKIGALLRAGRVNKGMPAFELNDAELGAIVAFIHDQKSKADAAGGGRRTVDVSDLANGDVEAGKKYFSGTGSCSTCHSPTGDLAGIGTRFRGLPLLQRMLYPQGMRPAVAPAKVRVTLSSGDTVNGSLASRDEFTIAIVDSTGATRNWPVADVKFTIDDPVAAHFEQLGKYSDEDMHNVYAYLQTLQ